MQTRSQNIFTTIRTQGAILPPDLLQRIADPRSGLDGLKPTDYGLAPGERAGQALSLPAPGVVQRNVELSLDARVHVPGGLAVADGDDAGGVHGGGESVAV